MASSAINFWFELATGFSPVELVEPLYVRLPDAVEAAL